MAASRSLAVMAAAVLLTPLFASAQDRHLSNEPLSTKEHIRAAGWWPTKPTPQRDEFLGRAVCAQCHPAVAAAQAATPMAKAGTLAANSRILAAHEPLAVHLGPYSYDLTRTRDGDVLSVSDGTRSASAVLGWAFGEGEVGETYVYRRGEDYYEARLSYFPKLGRLDITPGHSPSTPDDVDAALGRKMQPEETELCFGCHTTASSVGGSFAPDHLTPGVTCEACHGPGAKHVAAMKAGRIGEGLTYVVNPAKLSAVASVDFCGACHRAWADVMDSGMEGIVTVRFQPYRLELSRCWGVGDRRITCLACHDPHQPLVRDASSYDSRCLRCHLASKEAKKTAAHPGVACPRGTANCVTCHMPKYEVPGTHTRFTDHQIQIVQAAVARLPGFVPPAE